MKKYLANCNHAQRSLYCHARGPRVWLGVCERDEAVRVGQVGPDVGLLGGEAEGAEEPLGVEDQRLEEGQPARHQQLLDVGYRRDVGEVGQEVGEPGGVEGVGHGGRDGRGVPDDFVQRSAVEDVADVRDVVEDIAHLTERK